MKKTKFTEAQPGGRSHRFLPFARLTLERSLPKFAVRWVLVRLLFISGMDFVADQLFDGRKIRAFTVVDNFNGPPWRSSVRGYSCRPVIK